MTYVPVLAVLLLLYVVGAATRQITTVMMAALIAVVIMPDPIIVANVALLHSVYFLVTKVLKGVSL